MSTARRPQTDGLSERSNETMQQLLRCYACEQDGNRVDALPLVEFCFNNAINESLRISPFEVTYGLRPLTPIDTVLPYTPFAMSADTEKHVEFLGIHMPMPERCCNWLRIAWLTLIGILLCLNLVI